MPPLRRTGMTLIEVLAAVAVAGSLLAGITVAKARLTRQWTLAERKRHAVEVGDQLLSHWWHAADGIPREGSGRVRDLLDRRGASSIDALRWRTDIVDNAAARDANVALVRLRIRHDDQPDASRPLVDIRVVLPAEGEVNHAP